MKSTTKKYTIVSDPGIDDMIALLLLWKLSPTAEHTVVSTFGNVPEGHTSQNAKEFIRFIAPHWSFMAGPENPIKPLEHQWPTYFHGTDGAWGVHEEAQGDDVKIEKSFAKDKSIISLGPMTAVHSLMQQGKLEEIVIMGGAFNVTGNETKYAETNIAFDPDAAAYFFEHSKGIDVNVVPLDVTTKVSWTKEKVLQIPEDTAYKVWAKKLLLAWFENYGEKNEASFDLHDPLAVFSIFFPSDLVWTTSGVQVITNGEKRGQTILNAVNSKYKIALEIQDPQAVAERIFELLFK